MCSKIAELIFNVLGLGNPLHAFSIIILWITAVVMLVSIVYKFFEYQDLKPIKHVQNRKSHGVETFTMSTVIVVIFNTLQFRIGEFSVDPITSGFALAFGGILVTLGIILHLWSKKEIGAFWSNQIEIQESHKIVTTGPYAILRHPMYASAIVWLVGLSFIFLNYVAALVTLLLFVPMMILRATAEDKLLRNLDKTSFTVYSWSVSKLVPRFGESISILLRLTVIGLLAYSLWVKQMDTSRFWVIVSAHFLTGVLVRVPKVSFSYINKSIIMSAIYAGMLFFPSIFWLFYLVLIFDIWGLFGDCPCMMIYKKYNRCPCFDFVKGCAYKPKRVPVQNKVTVK